MTDFAGANVLFSLYNGAASINKCAPILKLCRKLPGSLHNSRIRKSYSGGKTFLVKAMFKARENGKQAKVIDRYLLIDQRKYTVKNIPNELNVG